MKNLLLASAGNIILYVAIGLLAVLIVLMFALVPIKTWFIALVSGAHVSMTRLIGMRMRRIPVAGNLPKGWSRSVCWAVTNRLVSACSEFPWALCRFVSIGYMPEAFSGVPRRFLCRKCCLLLILYCCGTRHWLFPIPRTI